MKTKPILLLKLHALLLLAMLWTISPLISAHAQSDSRSLQVVYFDGTQWQRWDEATADTSTLPLPAGVQDVVPSADHTLLAYSLETDVNIHELWVIPFAAADASEARLLATVNGNATLAHYANAVRTSLTFHWIKNTHLITYTVAPIFEALGTVPYEDLNVVDAGSGEQWTLIPRDGINFFTYSPDGSQVAAVTTSELRLIATADGSVQFTIPLTFNELADQSISYSPNGHHLVVFTQDTLYIINPADGSQRSIPFEYPLIGLGHTVATPQIVWGKDGESFYTLVASADNVVILLEPDATFTVWQIDVANATATEIITYQGFVLSAVFSPNVQFLAYWVQNGNARTFYITALGSDPIEYTSGDLLEFVAWNPASTHFIYWFWEQHQPLLGSFDLDAIPTTLEFGARTERLEWVDSERLLILSALSEQEWALQVATLDGETQSIATIPNQDGLAPRYWWFLQ